MLDTRSASSREDLSGIGKECGLITLSNALAVHRRFLEICLHKYESASKPDTDDSQELLDKNPEKYRRRIEREFGNIDKICPWLSEFNLRSLQSGSAEEIKSELGKIRALNNKWLSLLPTLSELGQRIEAAKAKPSNKPFWTPSHT